MAPTTPQREVTRATLICTACETLFHGDHQCPACGSIGQIDWADKLPQTTARAKWYNEQGRNLGSLEK